MQMVAICHSLETVVVNYGMAGAGLITMVMDDKVWSCLLLVANRRAATSCCDAHTHTHLPECVHTAIHCRKHSDTASLIAQV